MRVRNFQREYDNQMPELMASRSQSNPYPESDFIKRMVSRPIPCLEFTKWELGFTPKEHREMLDRKWMVEREREWREADRQIQQEIVATSKETIEIARDTARSTKFAAWAQAGTVVIGVVAIVVAVFFGGITIKDERSAVPLAQPTEVSSVTPTPESP